MKSKKNKLTHWKDIRLVFTRSGDSGEGELEEDGQKVQTSSYMIIKYLGCNVQHKGYVKSDMWYTGKLLREWILKVFIAWEIIFLLSILLSLYIWDSGCYSILLLQSFHNICKLYLHDVCLKLIEQCISVIFQNGKKGNE